MCVFVVSVYLWVYLRVSVRLWVYLCVVQVWLERLGLVARSEIQALANFRNLNAGAAAYAAAFRYLPAPKPCQLAWHYALAHDGNAEAQGYYARLGHGYCSCPEIYSRTPGTPVPQSLILTLKLLFCSGLAGASLTAVRVACGGWQPGF